MAHRLAVAVSGGRDSAALLHATVRAALPLGIKVHALHVHHGLMPQADDWQLRVAALCEDLDVPLLVRRLASAPLTGESIEAWARRERYRALADMAAECNLRLVLLAHHRRDQAETFLLQALRGAGTAGLASMPQTIQRGGITWARPWLDQPREAVEAYVEQHRIAHVDDDSNGDTRFARNRLRLQVMPVLSQSFEGAEAALAASARRVAEADAALFEWAEEATRACSDGDALLRERWLALSAAKRLVVLRHWLAQRLGQGASQRLVERLLAEWPQIDAASWPAIEGTWLRHYRGRLTLDPGARDPMPTARCVTPLCIEQPGRIELPDWGGTLLVEAASEGVPLPLLAACELRERRGGEQFQSGAGRPPRSLKKVFQQQAVPGWARGGPLLWCGDKLVFVPGLGLDARCVVAGTTRLSVRLQWLPIAADSAIEGSAPGGR